MITDENEKKKDERKKIAVPKIQEQNNL